MKRHDSREKHPAIAVLTKKRRAQCEDPYRFMPELGGRNSGNIRPVSTAAQSFFGRTKKMVVPAFASRCCMNAMRVSVVGDFNNWDNADSSCAA